MKPAGRSVRPAGFNMLIAGALLAALPLQPAVASGAAPPAAAPQELGSRPQWVTPGDGRAATHLISLLESAELDGLDPKKFKVKSLRNSVRSAVEGSSTAIESANARLDRALINYVTALRGASSGEWSVVDRDAVPATPSTANLLAEAAAAPSLEAWIDAMPFMHGSYAELRRALANNDHRDQRAEALLRINLNRARFLPASGRYVLVNTAAQRLYMYENGQVVDWMRVVVGKPAQPTPMMAAMIRSTVVNPYWNVPPDLAAERIAPHVVKSGIGYLKEQGYVLLSDWSENATPADPSEVDWEAVAAGRVQVRIRQNPGRANAMGRMKFVFPNPQGVYLHDTPNKELLNEAARLFSGGCVRLEDAPRLAKWLYGKPLEFKSKTPEQPVALDEPVPVYLAYLTVVPSGNEVVFYEDIYGKDSSQLAVAANGNLASR